MKAVGIDLGGTKIEAQVFDADWTRVAHRRIDTPRDYPGLVSAMAAQIAWADAQAGRVLPVGIAAAGLVNPATGLAYAANLAAMGHPFPADIDKAVGRHVTYVNDCRALTLSEAIFGAARGLSPAVGLILGTGIGGGVAVGGRLVEGPATLGGEFGHFAIAAAPVVAHGLPIITCGCGRPGCTETLIAGPGITRLTKAMTGRDLTAPEITAARSTDPELGRVWVVWCELVAEMLKTIVFVVDPACIVIGGGMSHAPGLVGDLTAALRAIQLPGFSVPELRLAQGGDASGARGAAYAAWQEAGHD
jgi:N-acetylglucosamine kinase